MYVIFYKMLISEMRKNKMQDTIILEDTIPIHFLKTNYYHLKRKSQKLQAEKRYSEAHTWKISWIWPDAM